MFKSSLYFLVLAVNIIAVQTGWDIGVYATKPLLIPLLGWMLMDSENQKVRWVWLALLFCWVGDILLMLPQDLFLFGLVSFLIAHLFYIRHFWGEWDRKTKPIRPVYLVGVALYLIGLLAILIPVLGDMRIPVIVYGIVSILALNKFNNPFLLAGSLIMLTYGLAQYFIVTGTRKVE